MPCFERDEGGVGAGGHPLIRIWIGVWKGEQENGREANSVCGWQRKWRRTCSSCGVQSAMHYADISVWSSKWNFEIKDTNAGKCNVCECELIKYN